MTASKIYLWILLFFSLSCNSKNKGKTECDKKKQTNEVILLDELEIENNKENVKDFNDFSELKRAFDEQNYLVFFDYFPDTFEEFLDCYGFDQKSVKKPLYDYYEDHILFLFNYEGKVESSKFTSKIFQIIDGAVWEADAVNALQHELINGIIKEPKIYISKLTVIPEKKARHFWYFVFDGSTSNDQQIEEFYHTIHEKVKFFNNNQALFIQSEFEKLYPGKIR
jgi:hypothetical protein